MPCMMSILACQEEAEVLYFRVLDVFLLNGIETNTNLSGYSELEPYTEISFSEFRLVVSIGVEYFSDVNLEEENHFRIPGLLPTLDANDPGEPIASQELESLSIISSADLLLQDSTMVPAGSSLNEYFITNASGDYLDVNEYLEWAKTPSEHAVMFRLKFKPLVEQQHRFNIWYKMKGEPNIASTTNPVLITL